jgi:hypothetical protein
MDLSDQIVDEQVAGQVQRAYQSTPLGELLSQTKRNSDGSSEDAFYGYDPHSASKPSPTRQGDRVEAGHRRLKARRPLRGSPRGRLRRPAGRRWPTPVATLTGRSVPQDARLPHKVSIARGRSNASTPVFVHLKGRKDLG